MRRSIVACVAVVPALALALITRQPAEDPVPAAPAGEPKAAVWAPDERLAADDFDDDADLFGADRSYFPLGVWFESVISKHDLALDKRAHLNLYVVLTDDTDLSLVRAAGMRAVPEVGTAVGSETVGWFLDDEIDMVYGPGEGYDVMQGWVDQLPDDGRPAWANYGKGVLFWETDQEAATFVNDFQQVVSADAYWYTDRNICAATEGGTLIGAGGSLSDARCHRAANYGRTVDRVQALVDPPGSKPVLAFVELGHPFTEEDWPSITPAQARAAVWSSIIHGARGIIYFNHSFGGPCQTQHLLRDPCYAAMRKTITRVNGQITRLAPALNSPDVNGVVKARGAADLMVKRRGGKFLVFVASTSPRDQRVRMVSSCLADQEARVLGEQRTVSIRDHRFRDLFAGDTGVHVYRVDASGCLS